MQEQQRPRRVSTRGGCGSSAGTCRCADRRSSTDWEQYHECAQLAEELGLDSMWVADHPLILGDCWTKLAALAVTTRRIRLGSLVSCVYYRNPVLLARWRRRRPVERGFVSFSGWVSRPAGWFAQLGLPFPTTRERQQALEETIQVVRGVSGTTPFTYKGTYARAEHGEYRSHRHSNRTFRCWSAVAANE